MDNVNCLAKRRRLDTLEGLQNLAFNEEFQFEDLQTPLTTDRRPLSRGLEYYTSVTESNVNHCHSSACHQFPIDTFNCPAGSQRICEGTSVVNSNRPCSSPLVCTIYPAKTLLTQTPSALCKASETGHCKEHPKSFSGPSFGTRRVQFCHTLSHCFHATYEEFQVGRSSRTVVSDTQEELVSQRISSTETLEKDKEIQMKSSKRKRTTFTAVQIDRLEHAFKIQQYVVGRERTFLAKDLDLNEIQIKVWFQNRRIKWRKQRRKENTILYKNGA